MNFPDGLRYTDSHEWVRLDNGQITIGITDFAQNELGDIVYVELPEVDEKVDAGEECGMIDSAKTTSPIYNPIAGKVARINDQLADHPELVNKSPYDDGWLYVLEPDDPTDIEGLLDKAAYEKFVKES